MSKLTTNFDLEEFVPKSVFQKYGASSTWFLNMHHVNSVQWLRDELTKDFGKNIRLIINNWHNGGLFSQRGFRTPDSDHYNPWSQHPRGNATDKHSPDLTITEIYTWLMMNQKKVIDNTSIRAVEDISITAKGGVGWLHLDSRWILNTKELLIVKP